MPIELANWLITFFLVTGVCFFALSLVFYWHEWREKRRWEEYAKSIQNQTELEKYIEECVPERE